MMTKGNGRQMHNNRQKESFQILVNAFIHIGFNHALKLIITLYVAVVAVIVAG